MDYDKPLVNLHYGFLENVKDSVDSLCHSNCNCSYNPGKNYVDSKQYKLLHKSFQSIRSPPLPLFNVVRHKMCSDNNTMKLSLYVQHWTGGAGENSCFYAFLQNSHGDAYLLKCARAVHNNFCQDCRNMMYEYSPPPLIIKLRPCVQ